MELTVISDDLFLAFLDPEKNGSHCIIGCIIVYTELALVYRQSHNRRRYKSFFQGLESGPAIRVPLHIEPRFLRQRVQQSCNFGNIWDELTILPAEAHEGSRITDTAGFLGPGP